MALSSQSNIFNLLTDTHTNVNSLAESMNNIPNYFKNCTVTQQQNTTYIFDFYLMNPQTLEWERKAIAMEDLNEDTQVCVCKAIWNTIQHIYR
jgi:hypothetical protein